MLVSGSEINVTDIYCRIYIAFLSSPNCNYFQVTKGKRILGLCQNLTEKITNILLSLKLTGEEYMVMKNEHQSIILGKQESHDLDQLTIQEEKSSFKENIKPKRN